MSIEELKARYDNCRACSELLGSRTKPVFGDGPLTGCKCLFLGEAPGKKEDALGIPFVGRSGKLLDEFLAGISLDRKDVFITNTILCRPPHNRNPKSDELSNCRSRLDVTIKLLSPKVVVTLGNFATRYMLKTNQGITTLRGRTYDMKGVTIIPMQHPAVIMYSGNSPAKRKEFENDFSLLAAVLEKNTVS